MIAVIQRVSRASVTVEGAIVGEIGHGLLVLLGVAKGDTDESSAWMARKVAALRIFEDVQGKMNLDVRQQTGAVLLVSQFTLLADTGRGNRPGFENAEEPVVASRRCDQVAALLEESGIIVARGRFGASMQVELINDGPVTIILDSSR